MTLARVVALTSADIGAHPGVSEKFVEKGIRRAGRTLTARIPGPRVGVADAGEKAHGLRRSVRTRETPQRIGVSTNDPGEGR